MKKCTATTVEEALEHLESMRRWKPFEYSGFKYVVKISNDTFKILQTKPRKIRDGEILYTIENQNNKLREID